MSRRTALGLAVAAGFLTAPGAASAVPPAPVSPAAGADVQVAEQLTFVSRSTQPFDPGLAVEVSTSDTLAPDGTLDDRSVVSRPAPYGVRDPFERDAFTGPFDQFQRTPGTYFWQPSSVQCGADGQTCVPEGGAVRRFRVVPVAPPVPLAPDDRATVVAADADGAQRLAFVAVGGAARGGSVTFEFARAPDIDASGRFREPLRQEASSSEDGRYGVTLQRAPFRPLYWHAVDSAGSVGPTRLVTVIRSPTYVKVGPTASADARRGGALCRAGRVRAGAVQAVGTGGAGRHPRRPQDHRGARQPRRGHGARGRRDVALPGPRWARDAPSPGPVAAVQRACGR